MEKTRRRNVFETFEKQILEEIVAKGNSGKVQK
jgi:hypothetical protein